MHAGRPEAISSSIVDTAAEELSFAARKAARLAVYAETVTTKKKLTCAGRMVGAR